jgi:hypothetical protein
MDPVTIGAVLLAIVSGAAEEAGSRLWDGVVALVRRPFRKAAADRAGASVIPAGEAELAALERAPDDEQRAVALAEVLLARAGADAEFGQALRAWWEQAEPVRASLGDVTNTISGGTQQGPVLQGRDFSNITFGVSPAAQPPGPPS